MDNRIGIVMAMHDEASPLIEHFKMKPISEECTIKIFSNDDSSIVLSTNGISKQHHVDNVGTQPAVLNAYILGTKFKPSIIINAGTAGGFCSQGAQIGDVYIGSEKYVFHDRRIPLAGFYEYGIGSYDACIDEKYLKGLEIKRGIISTGNSLDCSQKDIEMLNALNAAVKDMEAAAIAWICSLLNIRFIAIKSITDFVDKGIVENDFLVNFNTASHNLNKLTIELINNIIL